MVYVVKCSAVKKWQQSSGKGYDDTKIITHPYKRQTRSQPRACWAQRKIKQRMYQSKKEINLQKSENQRKKICEEILIEERTLAAIAVYSN